MIQHQEHFARKFYQDKKTGYWSSTDRPRIRAHRWVWFSIHGKIPPGYHIHHKNENKSDNRIENLELIEKARHCRHHMTDERREISRKWVEKIRPLTKEWHKSEEGKAWHRHHALKFKFGKWPQKKYFCDQCKEEFNSKKLTHTRFCSNKCKSKWRRENKLDTTERYCENCKNVFITNKYKKAKFCSKKCRVRRL